MRPTEWRKTPGGGGESSQGIDTPRVEVFPQGDQNPRMATEGDGVTGEDGRGRRGEGTETPPSILPRHSVALGGHSGVLVPLGKYFNSGGVNDLRRLAPPPPGFSATL